MKQFLFPDNTHSILTSAALLALRIAFAGMLMTHGWAKLTHFDATAQGFASMGGAVAAGLAIFAEFFCSIGVIVGLLYRLALIPMIFTMCVAFFVAHDATLIGENNGELAFLYLVVFLVLEITGPGKYAVDNFLVKK